jgi:hypothetical protein
MKPTLITLTVAISSALALAADQPAAKPAANAPAETKPAAAAPAAAAGSTTPSTAPAAAPNGSGGQPSAEQVLNELLRRRAENPLIEPQRPASAPTPVTVNPKSPSVGTAPKSAQTPLKREGQFIITRRGRMVRASGDSSAWMFVFDGDASGIQDPPMFLMPCTLLEDMEGLANRGGDSAIFVVSGQVFVYRGANYLLPTLMRLVPDKGNLKP